MAPSGTRWWGFGPFQPLQPNDIDIKVLRNTSPFVANLLGYMNEEQWEVIQDAMDRGDEFDENEAFESAVAVMAATRLREEDGKDKDYIDDPPPSNVASLVINRGTVPMLLTVASQCIVPLKGKASGTLCKGKPDCQIQGHAATRQEDPPQGRYYMVNLNTDGMDIKSILMDGFKSVAQHEQREEADRWASQKVSNLLLPEGKKQVVILGNVPKDVVNPPPPACPLIQEKHSGQ
eukprot:860051-Ditylum_brightwellii.AAC.2